MTLWSRVMFNWKAVSSQWGNFGTLLPPRGASFTPLCGMFLQSPSASSNVANFTFLRNPLSELWVCEFWLLRWSTMVARAWPVCVEVIQDWLLAAPSETSPPSCFYDTSILRYPFDLFQWKSMGRVAKVLKWLLGAWLDSFTMILRCWLVVWVKWARPLVSMTLWSRVMFNWKAVSIHFMGRPTPLKVNGATLGRSCPPGVQLLPHFEVWSYRACQPLQVWWFISFYEILALSYDPPKFSPCIVNGTFWAIICPWGEHRTPDRL